MLIICKPKGQTKDDHVINGRKIVQQYQDNEYKGNKKGLKQPTMNHPFLKDNLTQ